MNVFVDTSALIALADRRDLVHAEASQWIKSHGTAVRLTVSDYVLDETATLLRRRIGHGPTVRFVGAITIGSLFTVVHLQPEHWQQAWRLFEAYPDQSFSFTDCTSFVLMKANGITTAFAFDRHFVIAGFTVVPASTF